MIPLKLVLFAVLNASVELVGGKFDLKDLNAAERIQYIF